MRLENSSFFEESFKKALLFTFCLLVFVSAPSVKTSKFTGKWEYWWNKEASKGFVVEVKAKNGRFSETGSGFIPQLFDAEIKPATIVGDSVTSKIADDLGNTGTVKLRLRNLRNGLRMVQNVYCVAIAGKCQWNSR